MLPVILIGIGALLCVQACVQDPKVVVEVFYETYCPDSRSFVLDQLNSTYAKLSSIIKLELVPYGKASRRELPSGWYSFDCQHGDKECYGNLLQSCVIKYYPDPKEHLPLVACMFASNNPNRAYESCAKKQGFNLETLQKCVSGKEGNDLQLRYAELTESVNSRRRLEFVPWIRFNGKDKMYDAFTSFRITLCVEYKSMLDDVCTEDSEKTPPIELPEACRSALS